MNDQLGDNLLIISKYRIVIYYISFLEHTAP